MGVTVAICCYNSADRIRPTLKHLLAQAGTAAHSWEVLLVDNGSTDDTVAMARKAWTSKRVPLRIVLEPKSGLVYARKCAFREATFEYVTFIDDDNWVCPQWVSEVERIMDANPRVAALGTRSEPAFGVPPPSWFTGFEGCYAVGQQWPKGGDVTESRGFLWGAGLTVRKTAWRQIIKLGFRSQLEGRRGSTLTAGEDNEICQALRLAGWRLYLEPRLSFQHFIPAQRLKWDYLRKIVTNFGASSILLDVYQWCYSNSQSPWHRRFSGHWLHPAFSAIKALFSRPVATVRVLCGLGVGHPSAYFVYFNFGRLRGALRMRGRFDEAYRSISQSAQSLKRGREGVSQNSSGAGELMDVAVGGLNLPVENSVKSGINQPHSIRGPGKKIIRFQ